MIRLLESIARYPGILRGGSALMVVGVLLFLLDNLLIFGLGWPGLHHFLAYLGILSPGKGYQTLNGMMAVAGWAQFFLFTAAIVLTIAWVHRTSYRSMKDDAELYDALSAYFIRLAFWAVFLIGLFDAVISFLRVEDFLQFFIGDHLTTQIGRSSFRGVWVHYPLIGIAAVVAFFTRSISFIWLSLMIVIAEFLIVITRFVFSYEQAFQGDLVRFWYAGLFLFASAYTLMHDGHVRVDVLYTNFSEKGKAVTNSLGSLFLGLPLCWIILVLGTTSKGSIIISPLLRFEISQSGFGMYTKYLMAAYLLIFAMTMAIQFVSFFLSGMSQFTRGASTPVDQADMSDSRTMEA